MRWVGIGIVTRFECDGGGWGRVGGEGGWREKGCRYIGRVVIYLFILKYFAYVLYNVCLEICVQYNCCKLNVCGAWHCKGSTPMPSPRLII